MDKSDWIRSLEGLKNLLRQKKEELEKPERLKKDIEEIELTVAAYEKKITELSKKEKKPSYVK